MTRSSVYVVLTAAGSGTRLGHELPKALVPINATPILVHAINNISAARVDGIIITAPETHIHDFEKTLKHLSLHARHTPIRIVPGGSTRQASVAAGLHAIPSLAKEKGIPLKDTSVILVHDAARPLTPPTLTRHIIETVQAGYHAVIPALPVADTLKHLNTSTLTTHTIGTVDGTADRSRLVAVQTPQGFTWETITQAHAEAAHLAASEDIAATDDAGLVEKMGQAVHVVTGAPEAMKVTTIWDLHIAEFLMAKEK